MNEPNNLRHLADETLVRLAQEGDQVAFSVLIERQKPAAMRLALSVLRERCDAEDEVQNACWKAFQHLGGFQKEAKFSTWFHRIVLNQCLMRLRSQKRNRMVYMDDVVTAGETPARVELRDPQATPETAVAQREVSGVLRGEVRRMPPILRRVLELRDVQELPMADVAQELGISVPAAKSRLLRARQELRQKLERHTGRLGLATLTTT
jgi:RNA polymerase sigma-70 factor (ECF subfamily)